MLKTIDIPCLPQSKAVVAVSSEAKNTIESLKKLDIKVFEIEVNNNLEPSIASHADCNLVNLGGGTFICDNSNIMELTLFCSKCRIVKKLTGDREFINIIRADVSSPYPNEAVINVKSFGSGIVCNTSLVAPSIKEFAEKNNIKLYHCNQGYVGCSTVLVAQKAIMTDDKSVYDTFNRIGFDCLMLSKGQIKLIGHEYGFIGGCCGFTDKNLLAFNGRLDTLDDADKIKDFLGKYNVKYIELTDEPLTDIGGIVPLFEEA